MKMKGFILISFLLFIYFIYGCGSGSTDNKTDQNRVNFSFTLPTELSNLTIPDLQAELTIDDGSNKTTPINLKVDSDNQTASGQMDNVPADGRSYRFSLTYFVVRNGAKINLATGITTAEISGDHQENSLEIKITDLDRNIDDDNDGFTNLAEVRIGTGPLDNSDRPLSSHTRNSTKYRFTDRLGDIAFDSGEIKSQSGRYKIEIGYLR